MSEHARVERLACGLCTGQVVKPSEPALKQSVIILTSCKTVVLVLQPLGLFQSGQAHFKTIRPTLKPSDGFKTAQVLSWSLIYIYVHVYMCMCCIFYMHMYTCTCIYNVYACVLNQVGEQ